MGRPPCCDKLGVKKGPWTPEEDIILVSYVQEHGPGNWRAVPANTGLLRCSKSCRLRWTNYLRPGIKRGNFTDQEEQMIIHLQALLGNRWAAIASYLRQRTDNDIKNYWNTHLKKKLKKLESGQSQQEASSTSLAIPRGQWERRLQTDIHMAKQALSDALSPQKPFSDENNSSPKAFQASAYASSTENIAKMLKNWTKDSQKLGGTSSSSAATQKSFDKTGNGTMSSASSTANKNEMELSGCIESLFDFESFGSSNSDLTQSMSPEASLVQVDSKPDTGVQMPISALETWLLDEGAAQDNNNTSLSENSC